ncbi:hypothetical protein SLS57_002970 [Botryosphaeria dothidea]
MTESSEDELAVASTDVDTSRTSKKRPIGVFSHVAIPVRSKRLKSSISFESEPEVVSLLTPRDTSPDENLENMRPQQRIRRKRVSYAEHFSASSEDFEETERSEYEDQDASESEYEEIADAPSSDEFDPDAEINASPEPEINMDYDILEDLDMDSMDMDEPKASRTTDKPKRQRAKSSGKGKKATRERRIDANLPPLSSIEDIFDDITKQALDRGLQETLRALNGQELRIATMCSGTESPVLALQLVSDALEKHGAAPLRLNHVFSAEIVPKKQAYIERNFHPPIIFRDIRELTREDAIRSGSTNVYGAKVPIPGDIDLLVAGFSCVDYSALNNKGKTLNQKGESRDTLEAILSYAEKWTPKMIVLENVYGAPWEKCVERAKKVGYAAEFVRVDTKDYYLPHTRTRGYMVCIHEKQFPGNARTAARQWKDLMFESKRRASAPASAFLLPADDLRVHQFNSQLTSQYRQDGKERIFDWDACRHRHQKARQQDRLGFQRPITNWVDNGTCVAFEHAHKLWLAKQVERVWDCIEIRFLRSAKDSATSRGYDPMFKTSIMELSQNVDRFAQEMPFGICSCITPSGIFYITDRGGPLTPYETLALQGLPLDKISFTVETMRELQDLAGNAMSSTVVGVAQLAALIVASPTLKQTRQNPPRLGLSTTFSRTDLTLRGEKLLRRIVYQAVNTADEFSLQRLCDDASQSVRLCRCEGQFGVTDKDILICEQCEHTVCTHPPTLSWNVTTEYVPPSTLSLPPFRLLSNLEDEEYIQPRGFMLNLRPAQRRSLSWMRGQEKGTKFRLQEVAEEIIEPIRWKIEAKAEVDLEVKGGVIADQVSYGKTVTSLALIHEGFCENASAPTDGTGLIPLKATLILVPNSLPNQWKQEALKCLPKAEYSPQEILVIKTKKDFETTRIDDLKRAKVVIAPFNLCGQDFYINRLARLTALPETPSTNERHHKAWFKYALRRIPDMNTKLQELGVSSFKDYLNEELERTWEHPDFTGIIPSRRTKGANYKSLDEQPVISKEKTKPLSRKVTAVPRSTSARKGDWGQMKMPVLHQFKWNRVVIDEFHYPRGKDYTALVTLSAEKRWILSGTPPLDDFADVKRFAAFLGVDLGIDWDAPGVITSENSKQMRKEKTSFELFQTFSEKRSPTWHERRHAHAQTFLDTFARQNFAEIGDVKCFEALKSVELSLDHRAVYEELSAHMQGCQMNIGKKPSNTETGDRVTHIRQSMRASRTAEEALINFSSVRIVEDFSESACSALVRKRKVELCRQEQKIRGHIFQAARLAKSLGDPGSEWSNWISGYTGDKSIEIEDLVAHEGLKSMIESAGEECGKVNHKRSATAATKLQKLVRNTLGAEARNFVAMRRSLRYARSVLKIYQQFQQSDATRDWDCGNKSHLAPASDVTLLVGCGHVLCQDCLGTAISEERCCISGCNMGIREHSVLSSDKLRRCEDVSVSSKSFGRKLDAVIELLEGIPDEEQAIIFVQSYRMMSMVNEALTSQGISAYAIDNVSESASDDIENFINNPKYTDKRKGKVNNKFRKVLILNLGDESAAGMNLVNANHVVFISPLLTNTSQKYHAAMVQSIGRARRYGQQRSVNVYRFISPSTVDVDILEQRELRSQALRANQQIMAPPYEPGKKGYEKTQLIKNGEGEMMLVPKSWIEDDHKAHQHGVNLGVDDAEELERFTSLTMFSEAYGESGDG